MAEAYYIEKSGGGQDGPYLLDALKERLASGEMTAKSLVWKEGMADWVEAGTVAAFKPIIAEARAERERREAEEAEQSRKAAAARREREAEQARQTAEANRQYKAQQTKAKASKVLRPIIGLGILIILLIVLGKFVGLDIIEMFTDALDEVRDSF